MAQPIRNQKTRPQNHKGRQSHPVDGKGKQHVANDVKNRSLRGKRQKYIVKRHDADATRVFGRGMKRQVQDRYRKDRRRDDRTVPGG